MFPNSKLICRTNGLFEITQYNCMEQYINTTLSLDRDKHIIMGCLRDFYNNKNINTDLLFLGEDGTGRSTFARFLRKCLPDFNIRVVKVYKGKFVDKNRWKENKKYLMIVVARCSDRIPYTPSNLIHFKKYPFNSKEFSRNLIDQICNNDEWHRDFRCAVLL